MSEPITIAIVDDSSLVRRALRTIFAQDRRFVVVGEAENGKQAVELAKSEKPRLITMDLDMPEMNGLAAIEAIMGLAPTRILVITGDPRYDNRDASFEALSRGALDLVPKPSAWPGTAAEQAELLRRAATLASIPVLLHVDGTRRQRARAREARVGAERTTRPSVVLLGASTGGPRTLAAILESLPRDFSLPVVVVQHLADVYGLGFVEWLGTRSPLPVKEARAGTRLEAGTVYAVTRGPHVTFAGATLLEVSHEPPRDGHRPSIDVLFESAARACSRGVVAVLLTGMGRDGALGLKAIADAGGLTIAQDESTSVVFGMPKAAIELGAAGSVATLDQIIEALIAAAEPRRESDTAR